MQKIIKIKAIKIFLFAFFLFAAGTINAQVGIGIATPNSSAQLDVSSTSKGFLPPRMTGVQRNAITNPAVGLIIWCTNCGFSGELQVYNGTSWTNIGGNNGGLPSVTIGTQDWMPSNLDVTTYRNGDSIPEITNYTEWANLKKGAWCYYNNAPANGAIYGKLYNWYAVNDPRGLAPAGWYLPSDADWKKLIASLGGESQAGSKLKATTGWDSFLNNNGNGSNISGFSGLPGGYRLYYNGGFNNIGLTGAFWALDGPINPIGFFLNSGTDMIARSFNPIPFVSGYSVRCLRERESVIIGTQEWMTKNLGVTTYRNGDLIPEIEDPAVWKTLTYGAWCYYDHNSNNGTIYGKLYNWYAVTDPRGVAPAGWHVASDDEWTTLTNNLGGVTVPFPAGGYEIKTVGGKLKEVGTTHWTTPNTDATDSSGFRALPGGKIEPGGAFKSIHDVGSWWTSSEVNSTNALYREAHFENGSVYRWDWTKTAGFSVRCVRD